MRRFLATMVLLTMIVSLISAVAICVTATSMVGQLWALIPTGIFIGMYFLGAEIVVNKK